MKLNQTNVITAQLEQISYPQIIVRDEHGRAFMVETNQKQRDDPAFWEVISAILKAQLWVPVSTRLHELFDTDWLLPAEA